MNLQLIYSYFVCHGMYVANIYLSFFLLHSEAHYHQIKQLRYKAFLLRSIIQLINWVGLYNNTLNLNPWISVLRIGHWGESCSWWSAKDQRVSMKKIVVVALARSSSFKDKFTSLVPQMTQHSFKLVSTKLKLGFLFFSYLASLLDFDANV